MNYKDIKPNKGSVRKRTRRGRGNASGLGGESGRGHKGQKSRSGYSRKPGFEGGQMPLYRRIPKKPGFKNPFREAYQVINLARLDTKVSENDIVDPSYLEEKFGVSSQMPIKILGDGELTKKITIKVHKVSKTAQAKLLKLGATITLIES